MQKTIIKRNDIVEFVKRKGSALGSQIAEHAVGRNASPSQRATVHYYLRSLISTGRLTRKKADGVWVYRVPVVDVETRDKILAALAEIEPAPRYRVCNAVFGERGCDAEGDEIDVVARVLSDAEELGEVKAVRIDGQITYQTTEAYCTRVAKPKSLFGRAAVWTALREAGPMTALDLASRMVGRDALPNEAEAVNGALSGMHSMRHPNVTREKVGPAYVYTACQPPPRGVAPEYAVEAPVARPAPVYIAASGSATKYWTPGLDDVVKLLASRPMTAREMIVAACGRQPLDGEVRVVGRRLAELFNTTGSPLARWNSMHGFVYSLHSTVPKAIAVLSRARDLDVGEVSSVESQVPDAVQFLISYHTDATFETDDPETAERHRRAVRYLRSMPVK